jgi:gliding motility-associated-like protein
LSKVAAGNHSLRLTVASDVGCISNTYSANFDIKNAPAITINANDGCVNAPILFTGQTDPSTSVDNWHWNFGDNVFSEDKNTQHIYSLPSSYSVQLSATGSNGCIGFASKNIKAIKAIANAGKDTIVIQNTLFQLLGSGGSSYTWTPSTGLSNPSISNPVGTAANDIKYLLTVKTPEGCTDTASINITVFKGSAIYVPTAFTPNNDGLNDILKPNFIGIKTLYYFTIYNRWGQKVFSTNDVNKGWNGYFKGNIVDGESFAWVLKAVDQIGKVYDLKGTFVLLK